MGVPEAGRAWGAVLFHGRVGLVLCVSSKPARMNYAEVCDLLARDPKATRRNKFANLATLGIAWLDSLKPEVVAILGRRPRCPDRLPNMPISVRHDASVSGGSPGCACAASVDTPPVSKAGVFGWITRTAPALSCCSNAQPQPWRVGSRTRMSGMSVSSPTPTPAALRRCAIAEVVDAPQSVTGGAMRGNNSANYSIF